ncbi:hypothetical protein DERF_014994 [Dermatophagoides farinae]|uniref:Uncharacterized protein n=1 Tax=Dermatophagoides farinae TaxID=6954 RepID=A0A922HKG4_DERFA|nr:hypothetical protein DERF_014994 [Dermatophagoides farinae]
MITLMNDQEIYPKKNIQTDVYIFVVDLFNFLSPRKNMEIMHFCLHFQKNVEIFESPNDDHILID